MSDEHELEVTRKWNEYCMFA